MKYPYTRAEECGWEADEAVKRLASLSSKEEMENSSNHLNIGWTSQTAEELREQFGSNRMNNDDDDDNGPDSNRWWSGILPVVSTLLSQAKEPLILMLLASAAISIALGNTADAISIFVALLIVSLVAAVQEYRSEKALEKLANLIPPSCSVLRDGQVRSTFLARDLVVGDVVLLATGDRVPADCRIIDAMELILDESSLTGENKPVTKTSNSVALGKIEDESPSVTEQTNVVFCGTLVTAGRGKVIVLAVGSSTEFGKIATELGEVTTRKSPLQNNIDDLGQKLAALSSLVIAIVAVLGLLLGRPFLETVTVAVSLAVAAIPEGLPICVTVTLALGVLRMAQRNAIVKKLPVVESLGCTTAVCSDKTGTLTQNEMTLRTIYTLAFPEQQFGFTGVGYGPGGRLVYLEENDGEGYGEKRSKEEPRAVPNESRETIALQALLQTACLCNNANLIQSLDSSVAEGHTGGALSGQPTELALLVGASKAGIEDPRAQYHRTHEVPFTSERKRMEVRARPIGRKHTCLAFEKTACQGLSDDGSLYFVKGTTEIVLEECHRFITANGTSEVLSQRQRTNTMLQARKLAASGLRVLGLAYGSTLGHLIFAGLAGMEDPPREGVADSVRQLRRGGVKVVMVTGDSKETAIAIARRCGILEENEDDIEADLTESLIAPTAKDIESGPLAMSGSDIDSLDSSKLADSIQGVRVFYRVVPRHKLALVRALQQNGEIVAMTGDGVNDATALKGADIGIAMGKNGTDVAKEAADVVLTDDDFSTITMAIAEGKGIFFNIRCFLAFQLSTSFAALSMESIATAFGLPSPLNAMQILWINIIMDGPPAQSLGVEPVDERILRARPRRATDPIVSQALLMRAITSSILIVALVLGVFVQELQDGVASRRDTTMTFMIFVNCDLFNAYVCRSADRCFYELSPSSNPAFLWAIGGSIVGQFLVIYLPPLQEVFQTEALSLSDLSLVVVLSSSMLLLDTIRKKFFRTIFSDL